MAISTYGELKAALSRALFHTRFLADYEDATIAFESAANRRLRVRQMETSTTLTTPDGACDLPTDYLVWRTVLWTGTAPYVELDYVHPAYLRSTWAGGGGDDYSSSYSIDFIAGRNNARIFTIEGGTFQARPLDTTEDVYEFHYYQKIPTIAGSDSGTNWLLTAHPDVYRFGVLVELGALQRNTEMAQLYKARRDEVFAEIIQLSALTTGATSPMVRTAEYF